VFSVPFTRRWSRTGAPFGSTQRYAARLLGPSTSICASRFLPSMTEIKRGMAIVLSHHAEVEVLIELVGLLLDHHVGDGHLTSDELESARTRDEREDALLV